MKLFVDEVFFQNIIFFGVIDYPPDAIDYWVLGLTSFYKNYQCNRLPISCNRLLGTGSSRIEIFIQCNRLSTLCNRLPFIVLQKSGLLLEDVIDYRPGVIDYRHDPIKENPAFFVKIVSLSSSPSNPRHSHPKFTQSHSFLNQFK